MKSDLWMPLYVGDYLRDTMHLSREDHGSYFLLILAYWSNRGPLPDDPEYLAAIAKVQQTEWQTVSKRLARFFQIGNGVWRHKRIDAELKRSQAVSEARSRAGKAGAQAKRKQTESNAEPLLEQRTTQHSTAQSPYFNSIERAASTAERPSLDEVLAHAQRIGLAEWKARDWFQEMEGGGWLDHNHRPVAKWTAILDRVRTKWEADGRPSQPPSNPRNRPQRPGPEPNQTQEKLEIPRLM